MTRAAQGPAAGGARSASFTQPLCTFCWLEAPESDRGVRSPHVLRGLSEAELQERCCQCGTGTVPGIWVRRDPATVPYPAEVEP